MTGTPQEQPGDVSHWLELKAALDAHLAGGSLPDLSAPAQSYFQALSFRYLSAALEAGGPAFERVPRPADGKEAWAIVLRQLLQNRSIAARTVLDDIFDRAAKKAAAHFKMDVTLMSVAKSLGWIKNQFEMRVRDVARDHARELGRANELGVTVSGDAPRGGGAVADGHQEPPSIFSGLSGDADNWGTETERRELDELGASTAVALFTSLRAAAKLGVFLQAMRDRRGIIISCEEPVVEKLAGIKKSTFKKLANESQAGLLPALSALKDWPNFDHEPRRHLGLAAIRAFWNEADDWLWEARWLDDLPAEHRGLPESAFLDRARDFTALLRERLADSFSEKELAALFHPTDTRLTRPLTPTPVP